MSARVFSPHIMSEMRQVMRGGASAAGASGGREVPRIDLDRVKKNLFNVTEVDQADSKQFAEKQLAAGLDLASKRWGFSFEAGRPVSPSSNLSGYQWEKVLQCDTVPEAYALRRMPFLNQHTEEGASTATSSCPSTSDASSRTFKQSRMDDFLKHQKRPRVATATTVKSSSLSSLQEGEPAAKKARTRSS